MHLILPLLLLLAQLKYLHEKKVNYLQEYVVINRQNLEPPNKMLTYPELQEEIRF